MAPRRPSAAVKSADARAQSDAGSEGDKAAKLTRDLGCTADGKVTLDSGSRGGEGHAVSGCIRAGLVPTAAASGDVEKLEAALAELRIASYERHEASSWQEVPVDLAGFAEHAELQHEVAWLRKAELQHQRVSELLELVSKTERLAATHAPHGGDATSAEALQFAQQSVSALVTDTSERLCEVERICTAVAEDTQRSREHSQLGAEAVQQAEEAARRGRAEVREIQDEAEHLAAEVKRVQRLHSEAQEHLAVEHEEAGQLRGDVLQLRDELSAERKGCHCKAAIDDLDVRKLAQGLVQPHGAAEAHAGGWETATKQLPVRVGVSTVAELVVLIFGNLHRPVEAADLKVFSADALAAIAFCYGPPLLEAEAGRKQYLMSDGEDEDTTELSGSSQLDETMEWFQQPDTGPDGLSLHRH
eukprot:CAMPEP_0175727076 /NCGR_PEP_ID=MMETSP0097-20121207/48594_1 /TAXON_ID=311494 /ORGANISM="Alexandrium monilatum, Strain CCMP3105" /LENGTH=415 /DNA_ID=CAMNT_0017034881 /DNA_START=38 /DNA_END=1281 /DNA_ORIENTATION=-